MEKIELVKLMERDASLLAIGLLFHSTNPKLLKKIQDYPLNENEDVYFYYKNNVYIPNNFYPIIEEYHLNKIKLQGLAFLWEISQRLQEKGKKLVAMARDLTKSNIALLSNKDLADKLSEIFEEYKEYSAFLIPPFSLEKYFDEEITKIAKKNAKNDNEIDYLKQRLTEAEKLNSMQEEILSISSIASKLKKPENIEKDIQDHLDKYAWVQVRWFYGDPLTKEQIIERAKKINEESKAEKTKDILSELNLSETDLEIIKLTREYIFLRTYRTDVMQETNYYLIPVLKEMVRRFNIGYDDALNLLPREIIDLLDNKLWLDKIDFGKRKIIHSLIRVGNDSQIFEDLIKMNKIKETYEILEETVEDANSIKGTITSKGIAVGRVKIVNSPRDLYKVEKGDVLVAVMTFPSYIVAMEKAVAFVTDEGGMLSHAAIIAREMDKPCITGTKIATKILKDGDYVLVDAEKSGEVSKI